MVQAGESGNKEKEFEKMKKNAKAMLLLGLVAVMGMTACSNKELLEQEQADGAQSGVINADGAGAAAMEQYAAFIEEIKAAFKDDFKSKTTEELDISSVFNYGADTLGYTMSDLDDDGVMELLLGEDGDIGVIYDIYKVEDGEMVHVVSGGERDRYYLMENGQIANEGSSGAANSTYAYYHYLNGELVFVEALVYDGEKNPEYPWFHNNLEVSSEGENAIEMSEEAAEAIIDRYAYVDLGFTSFAE